MCFVHAGILFVVCCVDAHWAETRLRDKLRTVSCLSGSSSALPAGACVGSRSHRTPGVLDVLPLAGCRCMRWSRPFEMVICLNTLSRPCHPGGDQACRSGEASRRLPQTWQTRLALLMHRRTLTKNRRRTLRMACSGPTQRNAPSAMRAALLLEPGFAVSLHVILSGVSRSVSAMRSARRLSSSRCTSKLLESGCGQATRTSDLQYWDQPV